MKSSSQQKRKNSEVPQLQNKCRGNAAKRSLNVTAQCQKSEIGHNTPGVPRSAGTELPRNGKSVTRKAKILVPDQQSGQHNHSAKIKLQLYPINEITRSGLEKDGYNPFLELTLSVRKKITSVIKHLNAKWGSSGVADGELMLFPFNIQLAGLPFYVRWTQSDRSVTAGEVHVAVGSPDVFRLSYGWISSGQQEDAGGPHPSCLFGASLEIEGNRKCSAGYLESRHYQIEKPKVACEEFRNQTDINEGANATIDGQLPSDVTAEFMGDDIKSDGPVQSLVPWDDLTYLSIGGLLSEASLHAKINDSNMKSESKSGMQINLLTSEVSIGGLLAEASLQCKIQNYNHCMENNAGVTGSKLIKSASDIGIGGLLYESSLQGKDENCDLNFTTKKLGLETNLEERASQSKFSWDDNLTALSIGGLLSEASLHGKNNSSNLKVNPSKFSSSEAQPISDAFDSIIGAKLNSNPQVSAPVLHESHTSILDAEETCHAFSFRMFSSSSKKALTTSGGSSVGSCKNPISRKLIESPKNIEVHSKGEYMPAEDPSRQQPEVNPLPHPQGVYNEESSLGLSGLKWNETLGPFDLGLPAAWPVLNGGDSISASEFVR